MQSQAFTKSKENTYNTIQLSNANIISTWFLLGCFLFIMAFLMLQQRRANFLPVTSYQLLVSSYQSLFTSYQSLVTSHQLLVTSYQLLDTSYLLLVISHWLLVTNHQLLLLAAGYQSLVANYSSMKFVRYQNLFPKKLIFNKFAMM